MEPEIMKFAAAIGANEPDETDEIYSLYRSIFRERNYFRHSSGFLVIKLSRSKKPFWGLTREIIKALNTYFNYHVILLTPTGQGWVFTKEEANGHIESRAWNLDSKGDQYKINAPLPHANGFMGPKTCLQRLQASET